MSETFPKRILGLFPLDVTIDRNLIYDPGDPKARDEFWDKFSFTNVNDLSIRALIEHDSTQELATVARGTLRLWISNKALHVEILPEAGAVSENMFFRMQNDPNKHYGLSPGYAPAYNEPITATGERIKRVQLREISVTTKAAHTGSTAVLETEFSMARVMETVRGHEKWLAGQKSRVDTKAKTWHDRVRHTDKDFRIYLHHQKAITEAIANSETSPMLPEAIEKLKRESPYFRQYPGMPKGYERASFSTR